MGINSKDKRDIYYNLAKKHGYRARSAFKLKHMDEDYNIFNSDTTNIVDLCAAPGSWSQYIAEKFTQIKKTPKIVAVDIQNILPIEGVTCIKGDITSDVCMKQILDSFEGTKADVIICDGAPDVTGLHDLDEYIQTQLLTSALNISLKIGKIKSSFVGKCFRSIYTPYVINHFKKFYDNVILLKPRSSRSSSIECFIYATGMKESNEDPLSLDTEIACEYVPLVSCGTGKDPDMTYELLEDSIQPLSKPISPPYEEAIKERRK